MKKIVLFMLSALAIVSCSKHDFTEYSYANQQKDKFESEFVDEFGTPASDQDWGFNDVQIFDFTKATTRGHNVEGNIWYKKWERPVNVTDAEKEKVSAEFAKVREGAVNQINIPWENYWVQQVHTGDRPSVDGTGTRVYPTGVMNKIMAYNYNTGEYEHVNNFNAANNTTEYTDDITKEKYYGTTLMIDMGTGDKTLDQFAYHNTSSSDYYYSYIILEIDGAYYVGFDIVGYHPVGQDDNANMDVDRDWIFDDWIVKISPAKFNMEGAVRIIAEDLGADQGSDFDYNDVVFDVKLANEWDASWGSYGDNRLKAYITLRAAGGTLPLTVAGVEVHAKFGVGVSTMYNTNAYGEGIDYNSGVSFVADLGPAEWSLQGSEVAKNLIPIVVTYKNGESAALVCETGRAPEKICVKPNFKWQEEYINIRKKYPLFSDWVLDKSVDWQH